LSAFVRPILSKVMNGRDIDITLVRCIVSQRCVCNNAITSL